MSVQKYLAENKKYLDSPHPQKYLKNRPRMFCKDGFNMSVQASATHYCEPRDNDGPYTLVEVGYPSQEEELLVPYAESRDLCDTVYGHVPIWLVDKVVKKHGGQVTEEE